MRLFGANDEIAPLAIRYLQISSFGMPLTGVTFLLTAALRGAGDTKTPLLVMLLVNGINILISWLLVGGQYGLTPLGVDGAAWGSTIGRSIGGIFIIMLILRGRGVLRLDRLPRFHSETMRRIIRIGLPTGVEMFAFQSALIVFSRFVVGLGTIPYAAHNTVITAESISFLPGLGFAVAATTLVGQNLGAKDVQLARKSGHEAYFQGAIFMGIMGLLFILIPEFFLGLLVNNPDVVAAGVVPLQMVGVIQPLLAANFVYAGALRGAGDTVFPLLIKLVSPWLIRVPLAIFLISYLGLGLRGAWIAMSVDLVIQGLLAFWRFYGDKWERIKV
jgi:putative MATE family efflux protein